MDRFPLIKKLLAMDLTYRALAQEGTCVSTGDDQVLRAHPRFAAVLPEWGMGEGILIFAQSKMEIDQILAQQFSDYMATLYDLQTGACRTVPVGSRLFPSGSTES